MYSSALSIRIRVAVDVGDRAVAARPGRPCPSCCATGFSSRWRRSAARSRSSGTAWRCMFEPISARLASSCSRNGIRPAETPTICFGRDVDVLDLLDGDRLRSRRRTRADDAVPSRSCRSSVGVSAGARYGFDLLVGPQPLDLVGQLAVLRPCGTGVIEEAVLVDARRRSTATRSGRCSCLPASRSGRCGRSARCARRAPRSPARLRFKPPGPEGRQPPLVGELRQRVGLVDDLRQLAAAEEVLDRRADALGVDQRPRASCPAGP